MTIEERLEETERKIRDACVKSGRKREDVKLIAVTKTRTPEEINTAIRWGITDIGENRVQELTEKYEVLLPCKKHLIGQLQTNKVKYILEKVEMIHSLDRAALAEQIEKLAQKNNLAPVKTLIEINIGHEDTKSGILPENLSEHLDIFQNFRYIKVMGLMTVAPANANEEEQERYFETMRELLVRAQAVFGPECRELSMGMSRDYEAAIRQGSTMIRLGSAIFGERNYNIT